MPEMSRPSYEGQTLITIINALVVLEKAPADILPRNQKAKSLVLENRGYFKNYCERPDKK